METAVYLFLCVLLCALLFKILKTPLKLFMKLLLNMISGVVLLFLFNLVAGLFGTELQLSLVNVLVAGILGIPGVLLLVLLELII